MSQAVTIGGTPGHRMTYRQCAAEGQNCTVSSNQITGFDGRYVAFGASGHYLYKELGGTFACTRATFGGDPLPGTKKACYYSPYVSFGVHEGDTNIQTSKGNVAYGANGSFNFITVPVNGFYDCRNFFFATPDLPDPAPGVPKSCYYLADYELWVSEGEPMDTILSPVAYGANGNFVYSVLSGHVPCNNNTFGTDPSPGVPKNCYLMGWPFLAFEGAMWHLQPGATFVTYGSGKNGVFLTIQTFDGSGTGPCTAAAFGGDPDVGPREACWGVN